MESSAAAMLAVTKARIRLGLQFVFYRTLIGSVDAVISNAVPTAATNGKQHLFNEGFVEAQTPDQLLGLAWHETEHDGRGHATRIHGHEPMLANVSMDYAINPDAAPLKIVLPADALLEERFRGMAWEDIYRTLDGERKRLYPNIYGSPGAMTKATPSEQEAAARMGLVQPAAGNAGEIAAQDMKQRQLVHEAAALAKGAGELPAHWVREIAAQANPARDWRMVLREFCEQSGAERTPTWQRPNRRFAHSGLLLPSLRKHGVGKVACIVDNSGSVDEAALKAVASELQAMLDDGIVDELCVIAGDTMVRAVADYVAGDEVDLKAPGGGGTDLKPLFKYVANVVSDASLIVCFTDLVWHGDMPPRPAVPVLFAVHGPPAQVAGRIRAAPWGAAAIDVGAR